MGKPTDPKQGELPTAPGLGEGLFRLEVWVELSL